MEDAGGWVGAVLHAPGIKNKEGDAMNDPQEYSHVDEVMDWITTIILVLIIITVIGVITGFVWGML
jgi:heme/copper-type cytochrome/quinol oxidase subunit 2